MSFTFENEIKCARATSSFSGPVNFQITTALEARVPLFTVLVTGNCSRSNIQRAVSVKCVSSAGYICIHCRMAGSDGNWRMMLTCQRDGFENLHSIQHYKIHLTKNILVE